MWLPWGPEPQLPSHCEPVNAFLLHFSRTFGTCVPTPAAFASVILGTLSIMAWLFAQLPQIVKNYRNKSTSGLSIYFLVEWCMGDISNFLGAILTKQATWQIVIGAYYCFVDCTLVIQWVWYEHLRHGKRLRSMRRLAAHLLDRDDPSSQGGAGTRSIAYRNVDGSGPSVFPQGGSSPQKIPIRPEELGSLFNSVRYGSLTKERASTPPNGSRRPVRQVPDIGLPSPSPRTVLFLAMVVALAQASPSPPGTYLLIRAGNEPSSYDNGKSLKEWIGSILSWASTILYLGSRLPQLVKNYRRRSTAGLSLTLFMAAFHGNLFYSLSMLVNPLAWNSYPAYGCHGWVRNESSDRDAWVAAAIPFFLGAAGVLLMDAAVGLQFWWFGSHEIRDILVVEATGGPGKWKEVSGWMRGWKPSLSSGSSTPIHISNGQDPNTPLLFPQSPPRGYGTSPPR